jgi:hypothetical protein
MVARILMPMPEDRADLIDITPTHCSLECSLFCFEKQGVQCFDRRLENGFDAYGFYAVGTIEATVVQARTTPEARVNYNVIIVSERLTPSGLGRAKDGYDGNL